MNVVNDPWIPVLMRDKSHRVVSLSQAFEMAEDIFTIDGPIHVRAPIISLLAGIGQTTQGKFNTETWRGLRAKIAGDAVRYLGKNKNLFELHGKRPFLQQALMAKGTHLPGVYLCLDRPSGDKTLHFDHDAVTFRLSDQDVVIGLLSSQFFRASGLYQKDDVWTGIRIASCKATPLINRMVVVVEGECLLDTIWYHIFPMEMISPNETTGLKIDRPFWERTFKCRADYESYSKDSYFGHLLPVPYAFYLHDNGDISESETLSAAKKEFPWGRIRHPMLVEKPQLDKKGKKEMDDKFFKLSDQKEVWRQLGATLAALASQGKDREGFAWAMKLAEQNRGKNIYLYVGGCVATTSNGILGFPESVFCIEREMQTTGENQNWFGSYLKYFEMANKEVSLLERGIWLYAEVLKNTSKDKKKTLFSQAERMYWSRMSQHRAVIWDRGEKQEEVQEQMGKWARLCRRESLRTYDAFTKIYTGNSAEAYGRGRSAWKDGNNE